MTDKQLQRRVDSWRTRLGALGLQHWDLTCRIVEVPFGDMHGTDAAVQVADDYDVAWLHVKEEALGRLTEQELDETLVHELLHVAFRDFENTINAIEDQLAPAMKDLWEDRRYHEREGIIERIAVTIVSIYYSDRKVVQS